MPLMDRIYYRSFLEMSYPEQASLIDKVRVMRTSALNAALVKTQKVTKSAIKNISKNSGTRRGKKMMKDPTKIAKDLLDKLTPEQIELIKSQFQNN
jgi:hypothetical protein